MIRKVYVIFILLIAGASRLFAQEAQASAGGADITNTSFGFSFQYVNSDYKIIKKATWQNYYFDPNSTSNVPVPNTKLLGISSSGSPGFAVGFIYRRLLNDYLEIRTTPSLVFADHNLTYQYFDSTYNKQKSINLTQADIPLSIKLKSERYGNLRAYLIGGVKYSLGIGSQKKDEANTPPLDRSVVTNRGYASYEAGIGFDIYFDYFKLSPEIKISNSFNNILTPGDNPYSTPLEKLFLHTVVFSLNFE
jgi:hypothetical protein